ncbi:MAG: efflux RND transporter periplasmic adaptor subunit [Myxococcales bacterium]|nr:efflux RND transporter periplasmic adaptor subunit [Myxococcales bacterium]MCB9644802.1 efflux RND transporter periplasmic adaptor subunit [Myxococcales bacterium]
MNVRWKSVCMVMCSVLFLSGCKKKEEKKEEPPIYVRVGQVLQKDLPETLRFTGDIEGEAQVQVYATVPDRIKSLYVDVGEEVKKGQLLAVIEHTRLRQAVAQVEAQLAATRANLAGARVQLSGATLSRESALRELKRLRRLYKSGAVGEQQVDQLKSQYDSAATQVQAAQAQIRALQAQIASLRASVGQAKTAKQNAILRSPIKGIVARRYRQIGDMATAQLPLFSIADMDEVKVQINITEKDLMKIRLRDKASIRVAAYGNRMFEGRVEKIAPTLDLDTRTAPVEIRIKNVYPAKSEQTCSPKTSRAPAVTCPSQYTCYHGRCVELHPLKPGMIANVSILVKVHKDTLMIPLSSLLNNSFGYNAALQQKDLAVLVMDSENVPRRQQIQIGLESDNGTMVQVLSGLKAGQRLIVEGQNFYKPGVRLKLLEDDGKGGTKDSVAPKARGVLKKTALR